jgi:hypothetical protein
VSIDLKRVKSGSVCMFADLVVEKLLCMVKLTVLFHSFFKGNIPLWRYEL